MSESASSTEAPAPRAHDLGDVRPILTCVLENLVGGGVHHDFRVQNFDTTVAWDGGREKAPAAICRKVAQAETGGDIEIWGNGD